MFKSRHWSKRAEEAMTVADGMKDTIAREMMLAVARGYLALAERARQREEKMMNHIGVKK
jgi:hypothetical protein